MSNCEKCNEPLMVDGNCFRREPGHTSVTLQADKGVKVRLKSGRIVLITDTVERDVTTDEALDLAENLNSAVFLKGDY